MCVLWWLSGGWRARDGLVEVVSSSWKCMDEMPRSGAKLALTLTGVSGTRTKLAPPVSEELDCTNNLQQSGPANIVEGSRGKNQHKPSLLHLRPICVFRLNSLTLLGLELFTTTEIQPPRRATSCSEVLLHDFTKYPPLEQRALLHATSW